MVRRLLWGHSRLRYRRGAMSREHDQSSADPPVDHEEPAPHQLDPVAVSVAATTATGGLGSPGPEDDPGTGRPWTAAAAREPLPPLAPPPARPGAGTPVTPGPRPAASGAATRVMVSVAVLAVAVVVIVLLVVIVGR